MEEENLGETIMVQLLPIIQSFATEAGALKPFTNV
jgi:hypothetical protein